MAEEPPPTPLRVHFNEVVDKTWPELRPRVADLIASELGDGAVALTDGPGCPEDSHIHIAAGPAITAEILEPALKSGSLRGVVLPHAGIPPAARATLSAPEFEPVTLFNLHHNATPTAEVGITLMLATSRRLVVADRTLREGSWQGKHIAGLGAVQCGLGGVVLVLGFGEIGKVTARVCAALGMTVLTMRRSCTEKTVTEEGYEMYPPGKESLHALLPRATHLMITCPLTDETRGLIGKEEFDLLPDRAVVVNVGRAEVVDEDALWDALQGHCQDGSGAARLAFGADVWWSESGIVAKPTAPKGEAGQMVTPPPAAPAPAPEPAAAAEEAVPPVVFPSKYPMHECDNVVMTPHYGGGRGLPNVEPARAAALLTLLKTIVQEKRWPGGANLAMGY